MPAPMTATDGVVLTVLPYTELSALSNEREASTAA
jgi:hypothetical protein